MHGLMKHGILAALAAAILVAGAPQPVLAQSAGDLIKERRALMQNNNKNWKIIRAFARKGKGSAADLVAAGKQLAANGTRIPGLFRKGTSLNDGVGQTRAKPAIWVQRTEFEAAAAALKAAGGNLAKVAAGGDTAAIKVAGGAVKMRCDTCHKSFRGPRKKK